MSLTDYHFHNMIRNFIFGESFTDKDVISLLFKIGWGYTICFVLWAILGKVFGVKSVAPYGKFVDTSILTGIKQWPFIDSFMWNFKLILTYSSIDVLYIQVFRLNAKLAWIIQELPAFVIPVLLLLEAKDSVNVAQVVISGMFLIHYFNRYV